MNEMASEPLKWRDALDLKLRAEYKAPVISNYQIAVELMTLMAGDEYAGRPLKKPSRPVDRRMFYEARNTLLKRALLVADKNLPNTLLRFPDRKDADPAEVLCAVDPFGHIAFLSAMTFHGLTNRLPRVLYMVTPDPRTWSQLAASRMSRDLGNLEVEFRTQELPTIRHTKLSKLDGMTVEIFRSKDMGGWRNAREGAVRVTTIARTFLQMLQRPELCGGIRHVMEVYEQHAKENLTSIITEFNQQGTKIDRVRAGYILEEVCDIEDPRLDAWTKDAIRGGSRKLDAQAEYAPTFSEKWCLSINV